MYLLDTNIISQTRRPDKADKRVTAWLAHTDSNNLYTSAVVMMELERGILGIERKDSQQGTILRQWLNDVVKPAFAGRVFTGANELLAHILINRERRFRAFLQ